MNHPNINELQPIDKLLFEPELSGNIFFHRHFYFNGQKFMTGDKFQLQHTGEFMCLSCSKKSKKIFRGFCYPCLIKKPEADNCIMSPHLCHYIRGTCRDEKFGKEFCYKPHVLYLAFTDKFKVGITRKSQVPIRWFDQGATWAYPLYEVSSRHMAGVIEKFLTQYLSDKSHWLKMLKMGNKKPTEIEFLELIKKIENIISENISEFKIELPADINLALDIKKYVSEIKNFQDENSVLINYAIPEPMLEKIESLKLDKTPIIDGVISGFKGQYLFIDDKYVFNARSHSGYVVNLVKKGP